MSYFSDLYLEVKYPVETDSSAGLRNAQIGALHAIAAHATLEPQDTSVIVMPTGSGKTTVFMLSPYILRKTKVLIVTSSAMVREQIVEEYTELRTLKNIGVFSENVQPPNVFEAVHMFSEDQSNDMFAADVVVATDRAAVSISENEIKTIFDYVIIDEAHHIPAPTWQKIICNMKHAAALLVTATPFRLDKKKIQGTHIYNYPLSKAYRDGIFGEISFVPIEEAPEKDKCIAVEAERVLNNDNLAGNDHYLMVRTNTKERAKELEALYKKVTNLNLKRIDSSMSYNVVKQTINELKTHKLQGIICVKMLGEGFDFPNLKIAAIHDPQKSLASTLQFVGRFARTNGDNIGTAKFIAMNDETLRIENRKLYTSDSIWQDMIISMSEEKINAELSNSEAIKQFSGHENAQELISLHNIRPNCHARVYRVQEFNLYSGFPDELLVGDNIYRNSDNNTVIGIAIKNDTPLWLDGNQAVNIEYNLFIVHYQAETQLLFIYSQQKTEVVYESIAKSFCKSHQKIARGEMHRVLAGFSNYEFFNTGMQNRYAEKGESYRIYSGSNTAASIDKHSGAMLSAGHAFCKVTQSGENMTIGYSSGSKLWSSTYVSIFEYISWCDLLGKKIVNSALVVKTNTNYDNLPIPREILQYSDNILFGFFNEKVYLSPPSLRINGSDEIIGELINGYIKIVGTAEDGQGINFDFVHEDKSERFTCNRDGRYVSQSNYFLCRNGKHAISLSEYFSENPLIFKDAEDTVYIGNEVFCGNVNFEMYDQSKIISFDWIGENTDVTKEFRSDKLIVEKGKKTIQENLEILLKKDNNYSHIIFDHGSGEIADYITLKSEGSIIKVELYHCKAKKGEHYNFSVEDVYEVAQQSIKSTVWVKSKAILLNKIISRITGSTVDKKMVRGDVKTLKELLKSQRLMEVTVYIVQPAISKSAPMKDAISTILSAASFYIHHTGRVKELKVMGSP